MSTTLLDKLLFERPSILGPDQSALGERVGRFGEDAGSVAAARPTDTASGAAVVTEDTSESFDTFPQHGVQTLEDVILGAWEGLRTDGTATCPVCASAMTPRYGAGPGPVAGVCAGCHSSLS